MIAVIQNVILGDTSRLTARCVARSIIIPIIVLYAIIFGAAVLVPVVLVGAELVDTLLSAALAALPALGTPLIFLIICWVAYAYAYALRYGPSLGLARHVVSVDVVSASAAFTHILRGLGSTSAADLLLPPETQHPPHRARLRPSLPATGWTPGTHPILLHE